MSDDLYIWIPNWDGPDGFQHYKERDPIWIKNYTRLLSHDEYSALSFHLRGILHSIWLEYARSNRRLRVGTATTKRQTRDNSATATRQTIDGTLTLTRRLGHRVSTRDLTSLSDAGFIELLASDVLAERLQDASSVLALARVARDRDREEPPQTPPQNGGAQIKLTQKDLRRYTGCKHTRGTHGQGYKHTPLGTDKPPPDWPHDKPTRDQVLAALADQPIAF